MFSFPGNDSSTAILFGNGTEMHLAARLARKSFSSWYYWACKINEVSKCLVGCAVNRISNVSLGVVKKRKKNNCYHLKLTQHWNWTPMHSSDVRSAMWYGEPNTTIGTFEVFPKFQLKFQKFYPRRKPSSAPSPKFLLSNTFAWLAVACAVDWSVNFLFPAIKYFICAWRRLAAETLNSCGCITLNSK